MSKANACSATLPGTICRNGFVQILSCKGLGDAITACSNCGHSDHVPMCMRDEVLPEHLFDERGMPRLAEAQRPTGHKEST
ncbi:hypothetical protein [Delftia sp.]|nr:hypothetical protein [Delftia sp.]SFB22913.1 hypothetical protein SAMN05444579_103144 [Delftia tsuruhatensis]